MTSFTRRTAVDGRWPRLPARRRRLVAAAAGLIAMLLLPSLVLAHPLGNFTINHYAGVRVEPDRILLDIVIDEAEIPAFQARLGFDSDGDGELSDAETEAGRRMACLDLTAALDLRVDDVAQSLRLTEAGLAFPPGAAGLSTMRTVCGFEAVLGPPIMAGSRVAFVDRSFAERLGWREIVVQGSGVTLAAAEGTTIRSSSPSNPLDRLSGQPPGAAPGRHRGGPAGESGRAGAARARSPGRGTARGLGRLRHADGGPAGRRCGATSGRRHRCGPAGRAAAVVPGGVGVGDLPSIFRSADLTPFVLLLSVLTAAALGAAHALTPGHGKTLMAAYLVGTRGTPIHAAGLGLSVALSHTLGILALAGLVVGAQGVLPPDLVVRTTPVIAAASIVAIGGWMLFGETRQRWGGRGLGNATIHDHSHSPGPAHDHADAHGHNHADAPSMRPGRTITPGSTATAWSVTATFRHLVRPSRGAACSCSGSPAG